MFCTHCGAKLPDGTRFCTECGQPVESPQDTQPIQPPKTDPPGDDFPDFADLAAGRPSPQAPADFDLPVRDTAPSAPDEPTHPISEQLAPPPRYDDLAYEAPPAAQPPRKGRAGALAVAAVVIVILAAVVIALVKFRPWTLLAGGDAQGVVSSEVLDRPEQDEDDSEAEGGSTAAADGETDWNDYVGFWSAGGLTFELFIEDDELNVTMQRGSRSYWDSADISDAPGAVSVELDGMEVRLKPRGKDELRIAIDGERYDAEPYSGALSPDTENSPMTDAPSLPVDDSGYLYYSPSTGTRSAGGNIPSDSSLHFWPLDQYAISTTELDRLTRDEVDIIRNEVFARHGYIFTTERWNTFFAAYDWYQPDPTFTEARFTRLEKQNIDTIVAYEKAKGWL